jgi:error-prone DNA polymerase
MRRGCGAVSDETGTANIIIRPTLFAEQRELVMYSTALLVHGKLQRIGEVIYLEAYSLSALALDAVRDDTQCCYYV